MFKSRPTLLLFSFLSLLLFAGCPSENKNLVNPPSQASTVYVRFFNFNGRDAAAELVMDKTASVGTVAYGGVSKAINPPADSSFVEIISGGNTELMTAFRVRFVRNLKYNFAVFPSVEGDSSHPDDYFLLTTFTTSLTIPQTSNDAYIKFLNAFPDNSASYSLKLGCPSGTPVASAVAYRKYSPNTGIPSGDAIFSLIKTKNGTDENLGLFTTAALSARSEHTIVLTRDESGAEKLMILDETDISANALKDMLKMPEGKFGLRVVNLSSQDLTVEKSGAPVGNFAADRVSDYRMLDACQSLSADEFEIRSGGTVNSQASGSLTVGENYTIVSVNRQDGGTGTLIPGGLSFLLPPLKLYQDMTGKASVRVIHADANIGGAFVSLGGRDNTNNAIPGYTAGTALADAIVFGQVSEAEIVDAGHAPISVFTSSQPARYHNSGFFNFEAGKDYVVILNTDADGKSRITTIESSETEKAAEVFEEGALVQIVNAIPGTQFVNFSLPPHLGNSNLVLQYQTSISTIVRPGSHTVTINGAVHQFTAASSDRMVILATGKSNDTEIFSFNSLKAEVGGNEYKIRTFNAAKEIPELTLSYAEFKQFPDYAAENPWVSYGTISHLASVAYENKITAYIYKEPDRENYIHRLGDVKLTFGKVYNLIFTGSSEYAGTGSTGYSVIIIQDY